MLWIAIVVDAAQNQEGSAQANTQTREKSSAARARPTVNLPQTVACRCDSNPWNKRVGDEDHAPRMVHDEIRRMQNGPQGIGGSDGVEQIMSCDHHDAERSGHRCWEVYQ